MDMGVGLGETILILLFILLFFGSKQMPKMLKDIGGIIATVKIKVNDFLAEMRETVEEKQKPSLDWAGEKKTEIRKKMLALRRKEPQEETNNKSERIVLKLFASEEWKRASSLLVYLSMPDEVQTGLIIKTAFSQNKRVIIPYSGINPGDLKISELKNPEEDLQKGRFGILEPKKEKIRRFFKSDLDIVICPGVAFDRQCGRLGFGKGYFDGFLKELRGMVPVIGLAFDFQILPEPLPFSNHDVPMNMIFTESEFVSSSK
jgi:5-formyltetrahydrofolate cyclo-ligase